MVELLDRRREEIGNRNRLAVDRGSEPADSGRVDDGPPTALGTYIPLLIAIDHGRRTPPPDGRQLLTPSREAIRSLPAVARHHATSTAPGTSRSL